MHGNDDDGVFSYWTRLLRGEKRREIGSIAIFWSVNPGGRWTALQLECVYNNCRMQTIDFIIRRDKQCGGKYNKPKELFFYFFSYFLYIRYNEYIYPVPYHYVIPLYIGNYDRYYRNRLFRIKDRDCRHHTFDRARSGMFSVFFARR